MILPDINLLLYAYNPATPQHQKASAWWQRTISGTELVGLPYEVCFGFVRIASHPRLGSASVPVASARKVVESWIALPHSRLLTPDSQHFTVTMNLVEKAMGAGPLISDAVLAAYALRHRATLCSNDSDFARFPGLDWYNPLLENWD